MNYCTSKQNQGFTVIEFLVVIAIMSILLGIALAGINLSRERARDDVRVSEMQTIMLALEQFRDACLQYPTAISKTATVKIGSCPYQLDDFLTNQGSVYDSKYSYVGIADDDSSRCVGYHLGVEMETDHNVLENDDDIVSKNLSYDDCNGGGLASSGFDGADPIYDVIANSLSL